MRAPETHGRLTSRSTWVLIGALIVLVAALALCVDRFHNGDFYLSLVSGRFVSEHGFVSQSPFATIGQGGQWLNQQWLSELTFFQLSQLVGPTGVTTIYALLITAPLALLLWLCRGKGWRMLVAVTAFYFPGILAVIHPRAAGFTVLIFSVLVALLVLISQRSGDQPDPRRFWWLPLVFIPALFALWANLHGGFVAGLLLLGLLTVGLAIDHWRGLPGISLSRVAALGAVAVIAAVTVTFATPLGSAIWSYMLSFQNSAISLASTEWGSTLNSPLAVLYLVLAACFAAWMWVTSPRPRRVTTLLVTAGFLVFAGYSMRNIIFIGPVLALQVAWTAPNHNPVRFRRPVAFIGSMAAAAALALAAVLGPPKDDPSLAFPIADYAIAHPPERGRIVTYAGVGSYINWRSPSTPVAINGWLEHYTPEQLRDNYGVLRAWTTDLPGALRRLHAGAVITHVHTAIQRLKAAGFVERYSTPHGTYLVRPVR